MLATTVHIRFLAEFESVTRFQENFLPDECEVISPVLPDFGLGRRHRHSQSGRLGTEERRKGRMHR